MLRTIRLRDFRCFQALDFSPAPGTNFIIGSNAQGKTSILESICLLLRLQSPRTSTPADCVRFGTVGFGLDGHYQDSHLHLKYERRLKSFALDSKPQSRTADYLAVARVAWISNEDLQLVRGGASARRRFLDFLGAQAVPHYLHHLRAYERALRSRNALLRDNRPRREIAAFDGPLVQAGTFLLEARAKLVLALAPQVHTAHQTISGTTGDLTITYQAGASIPFATALQNSEADEIRLRSTVSGPHRDDIAILLDGREASTFGSEGQQRSAALALKLAQARELEIGLEHPPVYLIDDIFGELDTNRRNNLLTALPDSAQKIITTTSLSWLADLPVRPLIHQLSAGQITPLS